jgi:serine/threonine-protein kinase
LREIMKHLRDKAGSMPLGEACFVVRDVAQALHHAYWSTDMSGSRLSVVHRDVSPHNVIVSYEGVVKLLDFGVAMSAVTEQEQSMIVGKWPYMSPEHTTPQKLDHRSDLFSLGVILYLLVSGALPFVDNNHREIVRKIRAGQFTPLHIAAPGTPQRLSELVSSLLAPNPDDRPQTGQEVANHLTEIARAYGFERSSADMVRFLRDMFPEDFGDSGNERISAQWIKQTGISPLSPSTLEMPLVANPNVTAAGIAVARVPTPPSRNISSDIMPTLFAVPPSDVPPNEVAPPERAPPRPPVQPYTSAQPPVWVVPPSAVPNLRRNSSMTIMIVLVLAIAAGIVGYMLAR